MAEAPVTPAAPATPAPAPAAAPAAPAAAPAAPAAPAAAPTAISTPPAPAAPATPTPPAEPEKKGYWPDDWLQKVSKGDEKLAKQLSRYASPEALAEAHISLRRRMDSGEFRSTLPKNAKPEEIAAWRKDNGIPEKPEAYDLADVKIPETDKEMAAAFLKAAHGANYTPEQAKVALSAYYAEQQRREQVRQQQDEDQRQQTLDKLNVEWGGNFRRNVNLVEGLLSKFPESVREALKSARLPDGTALFNHPDAVRGFASLALEINPMGIVVPNSGGDLGKSMVDRYKEIAQYRKTNLSAYGKDTKVQQEERDLITALMRQGLMDGGGNLVERKAA